MSSGVILLERPYISFSSPLLYPQTKVGDILDSDPSRRRRNFLVDAITQKRINIFFMSSLCGVGVRVRVNNFFSKTTRPRDMLFFLKDTLSIENEKNVQGMQICLFVCLLETLQGGYPHQKCENFNFLSQFSQ